MSIGTGCSKNFLALFRPSQKKQCKNLPRLISHFLHQVVHLSLWGGQGGCVAHGSLHHLGLHVQVLKRLLKPVHQLWYLIKCKQQRESDLADTCVVLVGNKFTSVGTCKTDGLGETWIKLKIYDLKYYTLFINLHICQHFFFNKGGVGCETC